MYIDAKVHKSFSFIRWKKRERGHEEVEKSISLKKAKSWIQV